MGPYGSGRPPSEGKEGLDDGTPLPCVAQTLCLGTSSAVPPLAHGCGMARAVGASGACPEPPGPGPWVTKGPVTSGAPAHPQALLRRGALNTNALCCDL